MSAACGRFEAEALERIERGEDLDAHFSACVDCASERSVYERLRAALSELPDDRRAPDGWEKGVWDRIHKRQRSQRAWMVAPALAAVAAIAVFAVWPRERMAGIQVEAIVSGAEVTRGAAARPGDVVRLRAEPAGSAHAELRVYRAGALVLRCGEGPSCRRDGDAIVAEVRVDALGRYETLLLLSEEPVAPPAEPDAARAEEAMNRDLEVALGEGARAVEGPHIDVY